MNLDALSTELQTAPLSGRRVAIAGRLASMSRRDAEKLVRERGGVVVAQSDAPDWLVVGDEALRPPRGGADRPRWDEPVRAAIERGELELVRESEFWPRLGLVDADLEVTRLYTPPMLASLVDAPVAAIRQWHRTGALRATREVRRLAYFDFTEVCVARKLAALLGAGCTLAAVHRKLGELARLLPGIERPLAEPDVVVVGRCLCIRRGDGLAEPSGQLLIDFDERANDSQAAPGARPPAVLSFAAGDVLRGGARAESRGGHPFAVDDLRSLAAELDECGRTDQALEVYRSILVSGEAAADDHFTLAELLYRAGDLPAARERYYIAIELDEDFVEARLNLGCLLAEQGELELAEAALRGAIEYHPQYADGHYHLARLLDRLGQSSDAASHWRQFVELAPASPWIEEAHGRIGQSVAP